MIMILIFTCNTLSTITDIHCILYKITKFFLTPLFMLIWPTVKTTQCMILKTLCYDLLL